MNISNLLFIIVLFFVWIAGYYHYTPKHPATLQTSTQIYNNPPQHQGTWVDTKEPAVITQEEIDSIAAPAILEQKEVDAPSIKDNPEPVVVRQVRKEPNEKKQKERDQKRTRRKARHSSSQPIAQPMQPIVQPAMIEHNSKQEIISIASSLVKKDIGYYKMLSWHYPYFFNLTVNSQPLFTKKDKKITTAEPLHIPAHELFVIRYSYEWHTPWGKRIGAKKVTFKPNKKAEHLTVGFKSNWKQEERIVVDGATKISDELLEEETAP